MFWTRAYPLRREVGGGWGALWNGIEPIGECHMGPKKLNSVPTTQVRHLRHANQLLSFSTERKKYLNTYIFIKGGASEKYQNLPRPLLIPESMHSRH